MTRKPCSWVRNLSMTMTTRWPVRTLMAKQFQRADAITLKDFDG